VESSIEAERAKRDRETQHAKQFPIVGENGCDHTINERCLRELRRP
jgi:hypothetical protein